MVRVDIGFLRAAPTMMVRAMVSARFVQLISALVCPEARSRVEGAGHAIDLRSTLAPDEAQAIAVLLAHLSVSETRAEVRESLLHALSDVVEWSQAPASVADIISAIDPATLVGSEVEYAAYIRDPLTFPG